MANPAVGPLAKLAIGPADPVTIAINYSDFDIGVRRELRDLNGVRGTYNKDGNRVVEVRRLVTPRLRAEPTRSELQTLMAWGMYGTPSGNNYPLGDDPAAMYVHHKPKNGEQWFLSGVMVDTMTLTGTAGEALSVDLDLVGLDFSDSRSDFPSGLTYDIVTRPFVFSGLVLTYGGVVRKTSTAVLTVAHNLDRGRFFNSPTLTAGVQQNRVITLEYELPAGENPGIWANGVNGVTASMVWTNVAGDTLNLTAPDVRFEPVSPSTPATAEGMLRLRGECYRTGQGGGEVPPISVTIVPAS